MTFNLSLYAVVAWWTVVAMALPLLTSAATQRMVQEQAVVASHRNLLLASLYSHNQIRRRRHLQSFLTDCDVAYRTLFEDPTLLEAAETWLSNLEASVASPSPDDCEMTDSTSTTCKFSNEVPGTQEFQDACTGAGGVFQSLEIYLSCTLVFSGQLSRLNMYFPSLWDCMPPNCEEYFEAALTLVVEELEADLESSFSETGISSICEAETNFPPPVGPEESPAPGGSETSPTLPWINPPPVSPEETPALGGSETSPTLPWSNPPPVGPEETPALGGSDTSPTTPGSDSPPVDSEETPALGGSDTSPTTPGSDSPPVGPEEAPAFGGSDTSSTIATVGNNDSPNTSNAVGGSDTSSTPPAHDAMTTTHMVVVSTVLTLVYGAIVAL
ncbi:hypothetical protein IV203_032137 [Nitzschia inconspicua]|uniref:Uncharacterized protein n=1 Tax=Nitzschia inconspicua TaxID=303405 RepID=A0A9K3LVP9_9STRA|nr:hypothetical protein IV203_032137 [Nitzschia inconspicua]